MKTTIDFPGLSLNEVRAQFPDCFYDQSWYASEAFANEKIPAGKWEVSLEVVKDSFSRTWDEQQRLIEEGFVVPPIAVLAYAMCKHFKDTGERTFTNHYARTSSLDSGGGRVHVGVFDAGGLLVSDDWDSDRRSFVGLASARKVGLEPLDIKPSEDLSLESRVAALEAWAQNIESTYPL